ncbi:hypothetical protein D0T53_11235 [Dysgonomonas sp. 216]|uniref:hypothetical protein n=1 Tax=Dysgonomonas sp. 216 TaxID=2302934 RepID=UPI0013D651A8|nr:hypothetical protein [Dysgonomonas sp. 216]NDW19478.1 hypothetical protein [Dysgonomonas sp. 216]
MKQFFITAVIILTTTFSMFGQASEDMNDSSFFIESRGSFSQNRFYTFGGNVAREIFEENSPYAIFMYGGYEFTKIINKIYLALEPRVRIGYLYGSTDDDNYVDEYHRYNAYYNTFAWGGSAAARIGYVLGAETSPILYLEFDGGLLNYHTKARVKEYGRGRTYPRQNAYTKPTFSGRIGIMAEVSDDIRMGLWCGLSDINSNEFLEKMDLKSSRIIDRKFNGEIGFSLFF